VWIRFRWKTVYSRWLSTYSSTFHHPWLASKVERDTHWEWEPSQSREPPLVQGLPSCPLNCDHREWQKWGKLPPSDVLARDMNRRKLWKAGDRTIASSHFFAPRVPKRASGLLARQGLSPVVQGAPEALAIPPFGNLSWSPLLVTLLVRNDHHSARLSLGKADPAVLFTAAVSQYDFTLLELHGKYELCRVGIAPLLSCNLDYLFSASEIIVTIPILSRLTVLRSRNPALGISEFSINQIETKDLCYEIQRTRVYVRIVWRSFATIEIHVWPACTIRYHPMRV